MKNNFLYLKNDLLRERFKNAKPFLTHDGRIADRGDFQLMFSGKQPIRTEYLQANNELTVELIEEYFHTITDVFDDVAREHMYSKKECWEKLSLTPPMQAVEEPEISKNAQDVLRGEYMPSIKDCQFIMSKYKACPMYEGLVLVAEHPLPKKLDNFHSDLITLAAA